jgi:Holliday junction resolvasome RuvABC endonuclease subunit
MIKKVIGIDCSSKTIGWCCIEIDDVNSTYTYVDSGYIKPPKTGSIIEKLVKTRKSIIDILNMYKPDYIGIEDIVKFMKGSSTAQTIIMLTSFNRMVGLASYDVLGTIPEFFNVLSIRHGLKENKIFPKKEDMPELVSKYLNIKFPYIYNKNSKLIEENYDRADGIAVALYYSFLLVGKINKKNKKPKPKKKVSGVKK